MANGAMTSQGVGPKHHCVESGFLRPGLESHEDIHEPLPRLLLELQDRPWEPQTSLQTCMSRAPRPDRCVDRCHASLEVSFQRRPSKDSAAHLRQFLTLFGPDLEGMHVGHPKKLQAAAAGLWSHTCTLHHTKSVSVIPCFAAWSPSTQLVMHIWDCVQSRRCSATR